MYEIKRVEGEDVLKRYNVIKIEIDKAMVHSSREWTAAEIIKHVIAEPNLFQVWEVLEDNTTIAFATTRVLQYNNFIALHIISLALNFIIYARIKGKAMSSFPRPGGEI